MLNASNSVSEVSASDQLWAAIDSSKIPVTKLGTDIGLKNISSYRKQGIPKKHHATLYNKLAEFNGRTGLVHKSVDFRDTTPAIKEYEPEPPQAEIVEIELPESPRVADEPHVQGVETPNRNKYIQPKQKPNLESEFKLVSIKGLIENPVPIRWMIKGFFERGGMNLMSGAYGSGKSLVAFDMAFCVATGIDWHGNKIIQSPVIILAGEGHSGIANRFAALELKYGVSCPDCLYVSQVPAILTDCTNTELVSNTVNRICPDAGLVIIDTLNRNFGGLDENSTKDMTVFVSNMDKSFRATGKTVLIVHHTGHNSDRGRGSSVLPGACESEFLVKANKSSLVLSCSKQKNDAQPDAIQFTFKPVPLLDDNEGNPVNSVVLEFNGKASTTGSAKSKRLSSQDETILTSLNEAITNHGIDPSAEIKHKFGGFDSVSGRLQKVVDIKHWRSIAYKAITIISKDSDADLDLKKQAEKLQDSKLKAFGRGIKALCDKGVVVTYGDYAWKIFKD